jgi:hypothetical protein
MTINQFYDTIFRCSTVFQYTARQKLRNDLSVPRIFKLLAVSSISRELKTPQRGNVYVSLLGNSLVLNGRPWRWMLQMKTPRRIPRTSARFRIFRILLKKSIFRGDCKIAKKRLISFVMSVRQSVSPSACKNSAPPGRIFMKFYIFSIFRISVEEIQV